MKEFDGLNYHNFETETAARVDNIDQYIEKTRGQIVDSFLSLTFDFKQ